MLKRKKSIKTLILSALVTASLGGVMANSVSAASARIWGQNRYETSASISKNGWDKSDYVVIASGENYPDALCAAPLAKKYEAPILLTSGGVLDSNIKKEIARLGAKHAFIIGKEGSVSKVAEDDLKGLVSDVKRLGGDNRYETSVAVAKELGDVDKVVVTSGAGFADALSIAPIAAKESMPILLTGDKELPQGVKNYLESIKSSIKESYVVGGTGVISENAASQVGGNAIRLSGNNRFETNVNVMTQFRDKLNFNNLYVVQGQGPTGREFADALSGSALAAKTYSPIILTNKEVPEVTDNFLKLHYTKGTSVTALGGEAAVPETIVTKIETSITEMVKLQEEIMKELGNIVEKLDVVIPKLSTDNEKIIVQKFSDTMKKALNDLNYDPTKDLEEIYPLLDKLTDTEKEDLFNKLGSEIDVQKFLQLMQQAGVDLNSIQ